MEVYDGQGKIFSECAVVGENSQDAPVRAVRRNRATAGVLAAAIAALVADSQASAGEINFTDDALSDPAAIFSVCDANDFSYKFVPERTAKIVIPAENFNVGVADSGEAHANQRPAGTQSRERFLYDGNAILSSDHSKHSETLEHRRELPRQ